MIVSNQELQELPEAESSALCPHCAQRLPIQYAVEILANGKRAPSTTLGFVDCGGESYLVAVGGHLLGQPIAE